MVSARQAQLAKAFMEAGFDVVGLHECRLPSSSICVVGNYTAVYSSSNAGHNGCGLWIRTRLADQRHLAVIHEDPSRLLVSVRSSSFSMNAFVAHSPIEGSEEGEKR